MINRQHIRFLIFNTLLLGLLACMSAVAQVEVNSADPDLADQGTISLDVTIGGSGFDSSAGVKFLKAGTKKSGGVSVNSVHFRNSGELVANIDVAVDAYVGPYDIEVQLSRGRKGKGTTLFSVMEKIHTDGEAVALNCELIPDPDGTVRNDGLGMYRDGVDKVGCSTGGTVQPNLSGIQLNTLLNGPFKKAVRKIDLAFGSCVGDNCNYVPGELLYADTLVEDMQNLWIGTGPYPEMDHIQLMAPGEYQMKSHMAALGYADRFVIQLISRDPFPPELGQGGWCKLEDNPDFDWPDAVSDDMTVYIWPDLDGDSLPDGYTITTGTITDDSTMPPQVAPGYREATICSTAGPHRCDKSDMCNLLGTVPVRMTLHATNQ